MKEDLPCNLPTPKGHHGRISPPRKGGGRQNRARLSTGEGCNSHRKLCVCECVCKSPDEEDLGKDLRWLVGGLLVGQQSAQMQLFQ